LAQADSATKPGTKLDADKNPSAMHNPAAGNPNGTKSVRQGKNDIIRPKGMKTSHVSATPAGRAKHMAPTAKIAK
jgi:hypothetical protein